MKNISLIGFLLILSGCIFARTIPIYTNYKPTSVTKPISVYVEPVRIYKDPYLEHNVIKELKAAFKRSKYFVLLETDTTADKAEYIVKIERPFTNRTYIYDCAEGFHLTVFTLGIFPSMCNYEFYSSYHVTNNKTKEYQIVDYIDESTMICGLITYPLRLMKNWSKEYDFSSYYDRVIEQIYMKISDGAFL